MIRASAVDDRAEQEIVAIESLPGICLQCDRHNCRRPGVVSCHDYDDSRFSAREFWARLDSSDEDIGSGAAVATMIDEREAA